MRTFTCSCGSRVFFDNSKCLNCGRELGFLPDMGELTAIEPEGAQYRAAASVYRKCANYVDLGVCNWMIPASDEKTFCRACRLNNVIPDLSDPKNAALWAEVEKAKRRLVFSLDRLRLPLVSKEEDPEHGLAFDIKADQGSTRVLTGHADGLITLNLGEADAVKRERIREQLKERYRTLLGHFRHEVGHYYWEVLIRDTPALGPYRELFGDEREDYAKALERHYSKGQPPGYDQNFITPYAASHPWEDWAETFAHYLHMRDTLETAQHFGFASLPAGRMSMVSDSDALLTEWTELTIALNALNRSMGLPDAYPFAISPKVWEKITFVAQTIRAGATAATNTAAANAAASAMAESATPAKARVKPSASVGGNPVAPAETAAVAAKP
jgi:hypothetical protein